MTRPYTPKRGGYVDRALTAMQQAGGEMTVDAIARVIGCRAKHVWEFMDRPTKAGLVSRAAARIPGRGGMAPCTYRLLRAWQTSERSIEQPHQAIVKAVARPLVIRGPRSVFELAREVA